MRILNWTMGLVVGSLVVACGSDGDTDSGGADGSTSTAGDGTSMSASMSGATAADGSGSGATTTPPTTGMTTDATGTGTDTSDTTGTADNCVGLDEMACRNAKGCTQIQCQEYVMVPQGVEPWCLAGAAFVGCRTEDKGCFEVRTVGCAGDDAPTYICPDSCLPDTWFECDPPVQGAAPPCNGG